MDSQGGHGREHRAIDEFVEATGKLADSMGLQFVMSLYDPRGCIDNHTRTNMESLILAAEIALLTVKQLRDDSDGFTEARQNYRTLHRRHKKTGS
jgi:hypothetical protein